jgi:hypothetical protein
MVSEISTEMVVRYYFSAFLEVLEVSKECIIYYQIW